MTGWRGVRGLRGDRGRGVTGPVSTGSSAGTVTGRGAVSAGPAVTESARSVTSSSVRYADADPADGAGAFDADVGDAGGGLADVVGAGPGVAGAVAEDHVDLERVVQAQGDAGGEQVAPADDVLAGVLHRGEDGDPDRAALGQQQPQRLVDPPGRGPVGERGQGGELVDDHEHVRRPRPRDVLANPLGGECLGAGVHDGDEVLQQVAHRLGGGVLEPGEQPPAGPQLHAALGVDRPHLHPARRDGRGQPVQEGPDHRALPGPGRAGDEDVRAEQAKPPQGAVLAPAHRHPRQAHRLLDREGPDRLREGVAPVELDDRPPRGRGGQAGLAGAEAVRDAVEAVGDVVRGQPHREPQPQPFDARRGHASTSAGTAWPGPTRPPRSWA